LSISISTLEVTIEDERRKSIEAKESCGSSERRCASLSGEIDELRAAIEQADRSRRSLETELHDALDRIGELCAMNSNLSSYKIKYETEFLAVQNDFDETRNELRNSEERYRRVMLDLTKITEELKSEQEHSINSEKMRKHLEVQIRELHIRIEHCENSDSKGSKRIIQKLQHKIAELESQLEAEQKRQGETMKEIRNNGRRLKDLVAQADDDKRSIVHLQELNDLLNGKIKAYRRQCEETEEIAALNLTKYRKVLQQVEDATERADQAENAVAKLRSRNRSSMSMGRSSAVREMPSSSNTTSVVHTSSSVKRVTVEESS